MMPWQDQQQFVLQTFGKAWEESKHPRDHGRFSSKPGASESAENDNGKPSHPHDSSGESHAAVTEHLSAVHEHATEEATSLARLASQLPAKVYEAAKQRVAQTYRKLSERYGKPMATFILGAGLLGTATPLPGGGVIAAAPLIGAAELYLRLRGSSGEKALDAWLSEMGQKAYDSLAAASAPAPNAVLDVPNVRQLHNFDCILPGQILQGRIIGASKAGYAGEAIEIRTAGGAVLSVTPNHPVLTMMGFVPAGKLKKGDRLLKNVRENQAAVLGDDVQNAPAVVEQVFETLFHIAGAVSAPHESVCGPLDFHGDAKGFQGKIEIVGSYCQLWADRVSHCTKGFSQSILVGTNSTLRAKCRCRSLDTRLQSTLAADSSAMSGDRLCDTLFAGHSAPDNLPSFRPISYRNALVNECLEQQFLTKSSFPADLLQGGSGFVSDNECVQVGNGSAAQDGNLGFRQRSDSAFEDTSIDCLPADIELVSEFLDRHAFALALQKRFSVGKIRADLFSHQPTCFGSGSELHALLDEPLLNSVPRDSMLALKIIEGSAGKVVLDEIVDIKSFHYDGPIYDFQSTSGLIIVSDLLISNCGAACTKSVADFFGVAGGRGEEDFIRELDTEPTSMIENGTRWQRIVGWFQSRGIPACGRDHLTLDDLRRNWQAGLPTITPIQDYGTKEEYRENQSGHYVIVCGFVGQEYVVVQDPSSANAEAGGRLPDHFPDSVQDFGKLLIRTSVFEEVWHDQDADGTLLTRFGIVIGPRASATVGAVGQKSYEEPPGHLDAQGGELPQIDPKMLERVDFITYPDGVQGSNCGNCRFSAKTDGGHECSFHDAGEGIDLRGQPVNDRTCCGAWDAPGTIRNWKQQAVTKIHVKAVSAPTHKFSSTQFNLGDAGYSRSDGSPLPRIQELSDQIADQDLAADGKEDEFHITVKYGLHTDDPDKVRQVVQRWVQQNKRTIVASLGGVSLFQSDEYDVVKIDVDSDDLRKLNTAIASALEHTDTHPHYNPHLTLAYVKPGLGQKYIGTGLGGHKVLLHRLIFSDKNRNHTVIDLWDQRGGNPENPGEFGYKIAWQQQHKSLLDLWAKSLPAPDVRQHGDADCGPTALAAGLAALGIETPLESLAALCGTTEQGTPPSGLIAAAGQLVSQSEAKCGMTVEDLASAVSAGAPVICAVQSEGEGHYVCVTDIADGKVEIHDPLRGRVSVERTTWEAGWHDTATDGTKYERWGLILRGKSWDSSKHPRGQPGNAGEFAPSPGGGKRGEKEKKPAKSSDKAEQPSAHPGAAHGSTVKVKATKEMAAPRDEKGKISPVAVKTQLTKQETGRVAEAGIRAYLRDIEGITDTVALNAGKTNESIDLFGDSIAPEVKGGLCSNSVKAQQWRITFSMELGKKEQAQYDAMTPEQQKAWREKRQRACLKRKLALLKKLSQERGKEIHPVTYTGIVNPDTRVIDIYKTAGYHQRIDWNDPKAEYVGSVKYEHDD